MANNNNLKELIFKVKEEETQEKIDPMEEDIYRFIEKLKDYCLRNKELKVRIIYKVNNESAIGFFGVPLRNTCVSCGIFSREIDQEWCNLLSKWYFTENGDYLIYAVRKIAEENGFSSRYASEGYGWEKKMIEFTFR